MDKTDYRILRILKDVYKRQAYAFLMYKRDKMLKEIAEKRLSAIREFTDLGSGFKIAMRDLEILSLIHICWARIVVGTKNATCFPS